MAASCLLKGSELRVFSPASRTFHRCHFSANFLLYLSRSGGAGSGGESWGAEERRLEVITEPEIKQTEETHTQRAAACSDGCVRELLVPVTVGLSQIWHTHTHTHVPVPCTILILTSVHTLADILPTVAIMHRHTLASFLRVSL